MRLTDYDEERDRLDKEWIKGRIREDLCSYRRTVCTGSSVLILVVTVLALLMYLDWQHACEVVRDQPVPSLLTSK